MTVGSGKHSHFWLVHWRYSDESSSHMTPIYGTLIGQPDCAAPIVQAALSFGSLRRTANLLLTTSQPRCFLFSASLSALSFFPPPPAATFHLFLLSRLAAYNNSLWLSFFFSILFFLFLCWFCNATISFEIAAILAWDRKKKRVATRLWILDRIFSIHIYPNTRLCFSGRNLAFWHLPDLVLLHQNKAECIEKTPPDKT